MDREACKRYLPVQEMPGKVQGLEMIEQYERVKENEVTDFCPDADWASYKATRHCPFCNVYQEICKVKNYGLFCYPLKEYRLKREL